MFLEQKDNGSGIMPLNSPGGSTLQWDIICRVQQVY